MTSLSTFATIRKHARRSAKADALTLLSFAHSGLPYVIHFFIGQVQDHEITGQHASTHARYVGCVYNFVGGYSEQDSVGCENCKKQKKEGALSRARIPLTMTLLHHAQNRQIPELNSLDVEPVTEYLENHLTWKVVTVRSPSNYFLFLC